MSGSDPSPAGPKEAGRFAYEGLERVLHEKARLGILSSLVAHPEGLVFSELKELCDLTDGNLSRHTQVLAEAGLVEVWKGRRGNRPQTLIRLTDEGRARFLNYIALLEQIVSETLQAAGGEPQPNAKRTGRRFGPGWSPA
jgi:DNA-binding transcriptional ArsR family regulator